MTTNPNVTRQPSQSSLELEYGTLREEIMKRIELRQQFTAITLTFAGVLLGFGLSNGSVALIYPPLAALMAVAWEHNESRIRHLAIYIRTKLETKLELGWETHIQKKRGQTQNRSWRFIIISNCGTFLLTQFMAITIGLFLLPTIGPTDWVLLGIDLASVLLLLWVLQRVLPTPNWVKKARLRQAKRGLGRLARLLTKLEAQRIADTIIDFLKKIEETSNKPFKKTLKEVKKRVDGRLDQKPLPVSQQVSMSSNRAGKPGKATIPRKTKRLYKQVSRQIERSDHQMRRIKRRNWLDLIDGLFQQLDSKLSDETTHYLLKAIQSRIQDRLTEGRWLDAVRCVESPS